MDSVLSVVSCVKNASSIIASSSAGKKNEFLTALHAALLDKNNQSNILAANEIDIEKAKAVRPEHFIDRLKLTTQRIIDMANGAEQLSKLKDNIGDVLDTWTVENGLTISKIRVPFGVVGIIYEARPNVTIDAICLCVKSSNSVVLRGSGEAINTNRVLVEIAKCVAKECFGTGEFIGLIEDTSREAASYFMKQKHYIDVLLPRGGAGLICTVVENSTIPVIETGTGNCHTYVHKDADLNMALDILVNAKVSRPSVCNACESLLVDKDVAEKFLPMVAKAFCEQEVEMRGCEQTRKIIDCLPCSEEDYYEEFLGYIISIRIVEGVTEAIRHINKYGTKHSECIVTASKEAVGSFLSDVDAACVYHNASTRFTDGFIFGFGAEMGISTQKLHARGPMGLNELTSYKYTIEGIGQIRK